MTECWTPLVSESLCRTVLILRAPPKPRALGVPVRLHRISAVLSLLAAAACGSDKTTEPTLGISGTVSFSYTGAGTTASTTYSASGAVPATPSTNFGSSPWAGGSTATAGEIDVAGVIPRSATTWDLAGITTAGTTIGTY